MKNDETIVIYSEVVSDMTNYEKRELMKELSNLLQNMDARVTVSQEKGFPYFWRVLAGKNRKACEQILIDQLDINRIVQQLMTLLWDKAEDTEGDIIKLQAQVNALRTIDQLQGLLLNRMLEHFPDIDPEPIQQDIDELEDEIQRLHIEIEKKSSGDKSPGSSELQPTGIPDSQTRILCQKDAILTLATENLHNRNDVEDFIINSKFKHGKAVGWRNPNKDKWEIIFSIDECYIIREKKFPHYYEVLDSQDDRGWHKIRVKIYHPEELIERLMEYKR